MLSLEGVLIEGDVDVRRLIHPGSEDSEYADVYVLLIFCIVITFNRLGFNRVAYTALVSLSWEMYLSRPRSRLSIRSRETGVTV